MMAFRCCLTRECILSDSRSALPQLDADSTFWNDIRSEILKEKK